MNTALIDRHCQRETCAPDSGSINALARINYQRQYHPDLEAGSRRAIVHCNLHSLNGRSDYDIICAAGIDTLAAPEPG